MNPETLIAVRRNLRTLAVGSLIVVGFLLVATVVLGRGDELRGRLLLTFLGLAVGGGLARSCLGLLRRFPRFALVGLLALVMSQVCYLLLVWSGWTTESLLWRLWYLSLIPAVVIPCALAASAAASRRDWTGRATSASLLLTGLMLLTLGFRRHLPPAPGLVFSIFTALPALGALVGSMALWRRRPRIDKVKKPMSRGAKVTWLCVSHVVLLMIGVYLGRTGSSSRATFEMLPSALAGMEADELDAQILGDFARLRTMVSEVDDLARRAEEFERDLYARLVAEGRDLYLPEEDDQVRWLFYNYLSCRTALLRLVATYTGFEAVRDPAARARCFMVGYGAATATFRTSLRFVEAYRDKPMARRKLNEAERNWGIPAGMYDRILERVANERNLEFCTEMAAYFELKRGEWRKSGVWPKAEFDWLEGHILEDLAYVKAHRVERYQAWFDIFAEKVRNDAKAPVHAAQAMLAEWIGDTSIVKRAPLITVEQIEELESLLKPGDILLERRNWSLSNAFLPGFWPHAALYVGRIEDLARLGIDKDPKGRVQAYLPEFSKPAPDGAPNAVIEALSDGVIFNSITESMHADYVAVLRPRLTDAQIGEAIARAFTHFGKPYDFEFDFFTSDKLVCTELVYRAYEGMLHFDTVRVLGRDTLPALGLVRKFARERNEEDRQLDFVLFLDAVPEEGKARRAGEEAFCNTVHRPGTFNE